MSKTGNTIRLGAARAIGIVVQIVSVPIVWDVLGANVLGVCYFMIIVGRWVSMLDIGYGDGAQRLMTRAFDTEDKKKGFSVYQTHVVLLLVHATVGFALFVALGMFVEIPNLPEGISTGPLFLAGACVFATQYLLLGSSFFFNASRQFKYLAIVNGSQYLISGLLALGLAVWFRRPEAYLGGFAIGYGSVCLINLTYGLIQASKVAGKSLFDKEAFRYCFGFGAKLYMTRISSVTIGTLDRIAIMDVLGPGQLTVYTNAARVPEAAAETLPLNVTQLPDYTRAHMEGEKEFASQVERGTRISLMVGCGLLLVPCAFGGPVLQLWLQEKFVPEMAIVMLLIGVFRSFEIFFGGVAQVFLAHGSPHRVTYLTLINALLVLLLMYPAVRLYGIVGVAVLRVLIHIVQFVPVCWYMWRKVVPEIAFLPWLGRLGGTLGVAGIFAVTGYMISQLPLSVARPWLVFFILPVFMVAFFYIVDGFGFAPVPDTVKSRLKQMMRKGGTPA